MEKLDWVDDGTQHDLRSQNAELCVSLELILQLSPLSVCLSVCQLWWRRSKAQVDGLGREREREECWLNTRRIVRTGLF